MGRARLRNHGSRHGLARYGHARIAARGIAIHRDDRAPAGAQDRVPRGNRIPPGIYRRGEARRARQRARAKLLWTVPARPSARSAGPLMEITPAAIPDVKVIEPKVFGDARGFFYESWNRRAFVRAGLDVDFVQDNHSRSRRGVLRGLHYQIEHPQGKLVRVVAGEVFDVAVDLRRGSA